MQVANNQAGIQQFRTIYFALLAGQIAFAGVVFVIHEGTIAGSEGFTGTMEYLGLVILLLSFSASVLIFQNFVSMANKENRLSNKLSRLKTGFIIRWALLEGANLFLLVGMIITGNSLFMMLFAIGIVMFISARIRPSRLRYILKLNHREMEELGF